MKILVFKVLRLYSQNLSHNKIADIETLTHRRINQYISADGNSVGYPKQEFRNHDEIEYFVLSASLNIDLFLKGCVV